MHGRLQASDRRAFARILMPLKLATFNINNIAKRLAVLLEWLAKASPDIVCLQEIKVPDTRFPLRQIEAAGYGARWVGQPSWNGVAILAKGMTPVETRRQLPGDPSDTQSRYLEAPYTACSSAACTPPMGIRTPARSSLT